MTDSNTPIIETLIFNVSTDVAEIITQGYCDAIEDVDEHTALVEQVSMALPAGFYFSDLAVNQNGFKECEVTGVWGDSWECYAYAKGSK